MNTSSDYQLELLFKDLEFIEAQVESICFSQKVVPDRLEDFLDLFSHEERELLLSLLNNKLSLQESIFRIQGGNLDNITFLATYR